MMDFALSGLDEAITFMEGLKARATVGVSRGLAQRTAFVEQRFIGATPVDTGLAQRSWGIDPRGSVDGFETVAVVNTARSPRGFPYPSALLTGTGELGEGATPAIGYHGSFGVTPGMLPAEPLQSVWNEEALHTLATPEFVRALGL